MESAPGGGLTLAKAAKLTHTAALVENTRKTAKEIELNLDRVLEWLKERGTTMAAAVTLDDVTDYKAARRMQVSRRSNQKISAARVNRELDTWKRMMRTAVAAGACTPEVLEWFGHLREPRPQPLQRVPGRREIDALLRELPEGYRYLARLVMGSAIRDEETTHLDADDIRKDAIVVSPKPPGWCDCCPNGWTSKSYRARTIKATPATVKAARAFVAARPTLMLDKKTVWKALQEASVRAKIKPLSLHPLRKACASAWMASGVKLAVISKWLGHADLATTMRYLGISEDSDVNVKDLPW